MKGFSKRFLARSRRNICRSPRVRCRTPTLRPTLEPAGMGQAQHDLLHAISIDKYALMLYIDSHNDKTTA
jgi:hypothetical protein